MRRSPSGVRCFSLPSRRAANRVRRELARWRGRAAARTQGACNPRSRLLSDRVDVVYVVHVAVQKVPLSSNIVIRGRAAPRFAGATVTIMPVTLTTVISLPAIVVPACLTYSSGLLSICYLINHTRRNSVSPTCLVRRWELIFQIHRGSFSFLSIYVVFPFV